MFANEKRASSHTSGSVDQLISLVGNIGNGVVGDGRGLKKRIMHTPVQRAAIAPAKSTRGKTLPQPKAREVRPEQVIPMDDEDFKDF